MARCRFCKRDGFANEQGVKAHLRWCAEYANKKDRMTNGSSSGAQTKPSSSTTGASDSINFASLFGQVINGIGLSDGATEPPRERQIPLKDIISRVVDWHYPSNGVVTPEMAREVKVAILDQLRALDTKELPQEELTLRAEVIRDRIYGQYFEGQQAVKERVSKMKQQETKQLQQELNAEARQRKRKAVLIELGVGRVMTAATSRSITGLALILLEYEVRGRLETLLVGDETEQQVNETITACLDDPLRRWAMRQKVALKAMRERRVDQYLTLGLQLIKGALPWLTEEAAQQLCERLGVQWPLTFTPATHSSKPGEGEAEPGSATPKPKRRRRMKAAADEPDGARTDNCPTTARPDQEDRAAMI